MPHCVPKATTVISRLSLFRRSAAAGMICLTGNHIAQILFFCKLWGARQLSSFERNRHIGLGDD